MIRIEDREDRDEQDEGEEDARLLGDVDEGDVYAEEEDEAVRRGRLVARQFWHNTYHLHTRLSGVVAGSGRLTENQLRVLCGARWTPFARAVGETDEGRWWGHLARRWGLIAGEEEDNG